MALQTEGFAHTTFDPVSINCSRKQTLGDHHAQSRMAQIIRSRHNKQTIGACALVFFENPLEFAWFDQPRITHEQR